MKRILEYIYSGQLEITLDSALDYLRTGHMLDYPNIVDACSELLSQSLHPNNCLGIKEFASLYKCSALEAAAYNYILDNFNSVVEVSDELAKIPVSSLIDYLSADNANICNETVMWKAVCEWIHADIENRKQYLYELLLCVRLAVLATKELDTILNEALVRSQPKCVQLVESATNGCRDRMKCVTLCDTRPESLTAQVSYVCVNYVCLPYELHEKIVTGIAFLQNRFGHLIPISLGILIYV